MHYGQCVWLTTLPPSCADCLEIWEPQTPGTLKTCPGCNGIALPLYMCTVQITQQLRHVVMPFMASFRRRPSN